MLYPGEVLVDCGNLEAGRHRTCLRDEFEDAYSVVQELTASLETLQADEAEKIRETQVAVSKAEDTVAQRREALDDYLTDVTESQSTESEIKSKVEALGLAKANLEEAQGDLASLTGNPDPLELESKRQVIANVEVKLATAVQDLAELTAVPDPLEIDSKRQDIATAETKLADTIEALASLTGEPDELFLESKNRAIETAEADLLDAEASLTELMQATEFDIELADREIELAQAKLADAEEALAALLEDPDPIDVQVNQTAVRVAVESLADAEATLMEYNSVDQLEIDLRQADVIAARATLDTAIEDLERATLRAPFNGGTAGQRQHAGHRDRRPDHRRGERLGRRDRRPVPAGRVSGFRQFGGFRQSVIAGHGLLNRQYWHLTAGDCDRSRDDSGGLLGERSAAGGTERYSAGHHP